MRSALACVQFFAYNALKGPRAGAPTGARAVMLPALAGVLNVFASSPIFVLSTRLRTAASPQTVLACVRDILRLEGPAALWSGLVPSLWLVSNPAVQARPRLRGREIVTCTRPTATGSAGFTTVSASVPPQHFTYERLKLLMQLRTSLQFFVAGAAAKAVATLATYPLQVAQTLLRTQRRAATGVAPGAAPGAPGGAECRGVLNVLRRLLATDGVAGLCAARAPPP